MNKLLMIPFLNQYHYKNNPEYENLSDQEKKYMDYVNECLNEKDEKFSDACTNSILFVLEVSSKMDTNNELTDKEVLLKKEKILSGFSQKDKEKLETFMYACIQTMGIYSEESVQERKLNKEKVLLNNNRNTNI